MRTRGLYHHEPAAPALAVAAAWLGSLVLACASDGGQGSSLPADVAPRDEDEPAAPVVESARADYAPAAPAVESEWARDPVTGECSYYASRGAAPDGWLRFDSDIECRCSTESCPATIDEAGQRLCAVASPPPDVVRFVGCGLVAVVDYAGSDEWTFEQPSASGSSAAPSPRLVGAAQHGAAASLDAGAVSSWRAGIDPGHCDYAPTSLCQLCGGDPALGIPPCE